MPDDTSRILFKLDEACRARDAYRMALAYISPDALTIVEERLESEAKAIRDAWEAEEARYRHERGDDDAR